MIKGILSTIFGAALMVPALALAQTADPATPTADGTASDDPVAEDASEESKTASPNDGALPAPQSDTDIQPEVASPGAPTGGLVSQAGVGGVIGYGRAGVLELGGSAGIVAASDLTTLNVAPSIGWFVADNVQLSAMINVSYASTGDQDATALSILAEPSYHLPFNRTLFGFVGMGVGGAYVDGPGWGFALAPRIGGNFLVGRSGILTPSFSWQYTTHDIESMNAGDTQVLAVSSALRANIGYTIMW